MKKANRKKIVTALLLIALFVIIYYLRMNVTGDTYGPFEGFMAFVGN